MKHKLVGFIVAMGLAAAPRASAEPVDFARDVRPILEKNCYACHAEAKQKSGLRLDIKSEAFKGGDAYGPSIVAGKPDESPLIRFVRGDDKDTLMPPEGGRLTAAEVATLARWVDAGAAWPEGLDRATLADKRDHWSFKALISRPAPEVQDHTWPRNDVDRFILARLEQEGLRPANEAARAAWLRRVTFDLTGLPPTPEQWTSFVQATGAEEASGDAYARVVDELLGSPRYGERWAQHWLDVVRYADTHGFEVNTERPNAWPYRDYVIEAFNQDTPYDRFIREQIVGDSLGQDAATGFLITASVLLPGQIGKDEPSKRLARQDSLDDIVVNIGQTFLGLSVGCARCHDHKFDPISQREYYSLQAFVAGVEYDDRDLRTPQAEAKRLETQRLNEDLVKLERRIALLAPVAGSGVERRPVNPRVNTDRFPPTVAKRLRFTIRATNRLQPCIDELEVYTPEGENIALASAGATARASGSRVAIDRHELRLIQDGNYGDKRAWISDSDGRGWVELEFPTEQTIEAVVWGRDRTGRFGDRLATDYLIEVADGSGQWRAVAEGADRAAYAGDKEPAPFSTAGLTSEEALEGDRLEGEHATIKRKIADATVGQRAFAGAFREPDRIHVLHRGDPEQPKDEAPPATIDALGGAVPLADSTELARRKALADWLARPENPLTARVMVNRVWQGHFGVGLVDTPSDFGRNGGKPSHPELLDWLAEEFIRSGWSIKHLHRLIVLSATYRQSTQFNAEAAAKDADVRLLWRYPLRRLDAEAIRDSMLAVSGQLNLAMGGPGFNLFAQRGGLSGFTPIESPTGPGLRRMIYAHKVRRERDAVFGAFDCPDAGQSTARRRDSTTPIQALNLLNSRFTIDQSEAFALRVKRDAGDQVAGQIQRAYQLALSREATAEEIADATPAVGEFGIAALCRALFNSNEFLFLP